MKNFHLVILKKCYLDKILDGSKPVELRLLKAAFPPYGSVAVGDKLFLKQTSGPVCATASVSSLQEYKDLTPVKINQLKAMYNHVVWGTDDYWEMKSESKYAVFVWLKNVKRINPIIIEKKDWRAWVVLREEKDFGLLSSSDIVDQPDCKNINHKT